MLKFSYHEQREFERIDDEIAALEEEIAACDGKWKTTPPTIRRWSV